MSPSSLRGIAHQRPSGPRGIFLIKWSFVHLTPKIFRPLCCAFVWPHIENAIQAVSPYLERGVKYIEKFRRLSVRMVIGRKEESCERRVTILKLQVLEHRRLRVNLILVFCIMSGRFYRPLFTRPSMENLRGHSLILYQTSTSHPWRRTKGCATETLEVTQGIKSGTNYVSTGTFWR